MKTINIQSISDLITNSSTEVFIVYHKSNIDSIKKLVNSILSLLDSSKTFDDYFTIEMSINYDAVNQIFEDYGEEDNKDFPEFKTYNKIDDAEEAQKYIESLPPDRLEKIFNWIDRSYRSYWDNRFYLYEGFIVSAKSNDPIVQKVANVINTMDDIFDIDYIDNY